MVKCVLVLLMAAHFQSCCLSDDAASNGNGISGIRSRSEASDSDAKRGNDRLQNRQKLKNLDRGPKVLIPGNGSQTVGVNSNNGSGSVRYKFWPFISSIVEIELLDERPDLGPVVLHAKQENSYVPDASIELSTGLSVHEVPEAANFLVGGQTIPYVASRDSLIMISRSRSGSIAIEKTKSEKVLCKLYFMHDFQDETVKVLSDANVLYSIKLTSNDGFADSFVLGFPKSTVIAVESLTYGSARVDSKLLVSGKGIVIFAAHDKGLSISGCDIGEIVLY
jgi:hypothetical protein